MITPGKRQREEDEENASPSDHLYKARKIDISHLEISQDCKDEILNCLEEALSRSQGREAVRKKLRSLQDYLHSSAGTEDMKTIYHYYALAKTWGLSNDFFYFVVDNLGNNQEDPEEAEPAQLSDNFIQYLQLRQQREKLLKNQDKQAKYFASFEKLISQTEQSEFNSQPLVQILESYRQEASDQLEKVNRKLVTLSRKNGYPRIF
ncbi:hypothetical protein [Candidatus Odyssella thessalonicensis]|uniref:hypothetical protein n=1 Tax=Candidatus Odyssella thessalonicensis TaxID=84647 RepID=UPI000225A91E|nr:hypothetical protein [Candidatus Odyssella thessalonicensis]